MYFKAFDVTFTMFNFISEQLISILTMQFTIATEQQFIVN